MEEKEVGSIEELLEALREDLGGYAGETWYRGQANKEWSLLPSYLRSEFTQSEGTLLKRFKQSATLLVSTAPKDSFDWLFIMQHFGVPTRLLDWSESPLVALYFAVEDYTTHPNIDAALWLLRPFQLNRNAGINNHEEANFIPSFEDEELSNYSVESLASNRRIRLLPVATIATRNNTRIQAQLGVFTIHHNEKMPVEDVGDSSHVIKYNIPYESRRLIKQQLALLGFNRFQLFPELSSIGSTMKSSL